MRRSRVGIVVGSFFYLPFRPSSLDCSSLPSCLSSPPFPPGPRLAPSPLAATSLPFSPLLDFPHSTSALETASVSTSRARDQRNRPIIGPIRRTDSIRGIDYSSSRCRVIGPSRNSGTVDTLNHSGSANKLDCRTRQPAPFSTISTISTTSPRTP